MCSVDNNLIWTRNLAPTHTTDEWDDRYTFHLIEDVRKLRVVIHGNVSPIYATPHISPFRTRVEWFSGLFSVQDTCNKTVPCSPIVDSGNLVSHSCASPIRSLKAFSTSSPESLHNSYSNSDKEDFKPVKQQYPFWNMVPVIPLHRFEMWCGPIPHWF